jgi:YVTN family beta-propeller protein
METGPLPKMITTSNNGKYVAISHWGNNTVGLINIESADPMKWYHSDLLVVDHILPLNFSKTTSVDRDSGSGYALRGTVFTPDDRYLLVGCMGSGGGIAVIDMQTKTYLGRILGMMSNVRHLIIIKDYLYLSINSGGYVQRIKLDALIEAAKNMNQKTATLKGWENCKVDIGARTIEASPSGRYIFVACNNASKLYVIDTNQMKPIAEIDVDSYPVGLDVSKDGRYVIVTSQGRKAKDKENDSRGGNAVNIYEIEYAEKEYTEPEGTNPLSTTENDNAACTSDSLSTIGNKSSKGNILSIAKDFYSSYSWPINIGVGVLFFAVCIWLLRRRKSDKYKK